MSVAADTPRSEVLGGVFAQRAEPTRTYRLIIIGLFPRPGAQAVRGDLSRVEAGSAGVVLDDAADRAGAQRLVLAAAGLHTEPPCG